MKDMQLRYERLSTLAFLFIPMRRGWRLDFIDHHEVAQKIATLKASTRKRNPNAISLPFFHYETYLAEYFMLIADMEIGIVKWNKFRLTAFRVKEINEARSYLMYVQLK